MSKNNRETIDEKKPTETTQTYTQKEVIKLAAKNLRVIITNKKNSSWIDDLHMRDKLNSSNRVYH